MGAKKRLIATGLMILTAVPLLGAGTYAWLTMSTAPEITNIAVNIAASELLQVSDDGVEFHDHLNLNQIFNRNYAPLNPISTYDGVNWYLPDYYGPDDEQSQSGTIKGTFHEVDFTQKDVGNATNYTGHRNVPLPERPQKPELPANYSSDQVGTYTKVDFSNLNEDDYDSWLVRYKSELRRGVTDSTSYERMSEAYQEVLAKYQEIISSAYYLYADIWLKADTDGAYEVRLSVPKLTGSAYKNVDSDDRMFGSYALWFYRQKGTELDGTETESETFVSKQGGAETAVRVGFMPIETQGGTESLKSEEFKIYEPNADQRSAYKLAVWSGNRPADSDQTDSKRDAFLRDSYYTNAGRITYRANDYQNGKYLWTSPVKQDGNGSRPATQEEMKDRLIVQRASRIDQNLYQPSTEEEEQEEAQILFPSENGGISLKTGDTYTKYELDARYVRMGEFIKNTAQLMDEAYVKGLGSAETELASDTLLVTLKNREPQKIRIFFWLEGQDPDCWNDIADGSILVNLEFAGTPLPKSGHDQPEAGAGS